MSAQATIIAIDIIVKHVKLLVEDSVKTIICLELVISHFSVFLKFKVSIYSEHFVGMDFRASWPAM